MTTYPSMGQENRYRSLTSSIPASSTSARRRFPKSAAIVLHHPHHRRKSLITRILSSSKPSGTDNFTTAGVQQPAARQMAPLTGTFHPSDLQDRVQYVANGKRRKPGVDLKTCELRQLLQYSCDLRGPKMNPKSKVVCEPVLRLFRK